MEKLAWPLPLSGTGACGVPSTENVTVPVGVLPPVVAATVAVKVTLPPKLDGFWLEASETVVPIWLTVCVSVSLEAT